MRLRNPCHRDENAFLRFVPCVIEDEGQRNGSDGHGFGAGSITIDLAGDSLNDPPTGDGVTTEALSVFNNVLGICNQGTQPVCVDIAVSGPVVPIDADLPNRHDFGVGDPAVVFYRGGDRNDPVDVDSLDPDWDGAVALDVGECRCIGFEVRAFGFVSTTDLFGDVDAVIIARAGGDGEDNGPELELVRRCVEPNDSITTNQGNTKNGDSVDGDHRESGDIEGEPGGECFGLPFGGSLTVTFKEDLVSHPGDLDTKGIETTNYPDTYLEETALVGVSGPITTGFETVGTAISTASNGENAFEVPTDPVEEIRVTETTDSSDHTGIADGFDVDAISGWTVSS